MQCSCGLHGGKLIKRLSIRLLPSVVCLHLKRFKWSAHSCLKIQTLVHFPLESFDLARFCEIGEADSTELSMQPYDLISMISHHGSNLGSGHYTAICRNARTGLWHKYNDARVSTLTAEEVPCPPSHRFRRFVLTVTHGRLAARLARTTGPQGTGIHPLLCAQGLGRGGGGCRGRSCGGCRLRFGAGCASSGRRAA